MRLLNLFRRHLFHNFLKTDRRIGVTADGAERVPHICAHQIGGGHATPDLIIPADARLRTGMALHGRPQVPLERALIVAWDTKAHGIHHADKFFGIRIAGPGRGPERLISLLKETFLHHVPRGLNLGNSWRGKQGKGKKYGAHGLVFSCFATLVTAGDLPPPLTQADFIPFEPAQAALGHSLFYDTVLSGNRNISCAHCHHPDLGTGDGLSLGIGEGGQGLGPERTPGTGADRVRKRIPRNAPGLWNLGARDLSVMFHDGRLSISDIYGNGFNSPAEEWLPTGFNSLLAAQAVFPLVAQFEMAGNPGENEVIGAVHDRIDNAWPILAKRVRTTGDYGSRFVAAFDHINAPEEVTIVEIANALAAFMAVEWTSFDSPFDQYLAGDSSALTPNQQAGMALFYGDAGCSTCHAGALMSDQEFHALGLPAFGPGRTRVFDPYARDVGRMGESNRLEDAYAFRTPMLRNVALTAPYGHNGAWPTLEAAVRHHLNPQAAREAWTQADAALPEIPWLAAVDFVIQNDRLEMARQAAVVPPDARALEERQIAQIVAFLESLTGSTVDTPPFGVPIWFQP